MGLGVSLFLIAVGLILWLAVDFQARGIDITMVGIILVIIGVLGMLLSLLFWSSWGGFGGRRETVRDDRYDRPPPY